jgi:hypothetical protein
MLFFIVNCLKNISPHTALDGSGKANPVVALVEFSVVLANEDITKDPQRTIGWRNVDAHEARQANSLAHLSNLKNK